MAMSDIRLLSADNRLSIRDYTITEEVLGIRTDRTLRVSPVR